MTRGLGWLAGALLAGSGVGLREPSIPGALGFIAGLAAAAALRRVAPRVAAVVLVAAAVLIAAAVARAPFGLEDVLARGFAPRDGLFYWNPVLWLGLAGLASARARLSASAGALAAAVYALVPPHSTAALFLAGLAAALFGPAIASVLDAARRGVAAQPLVGLGAVGALLVAWNFLFMEQYRRNLIPRDDTVSFVDVAQNNAALLSRAAGAPTTWPASWLFALRHDVAPDRYERLAGEPARLEGAGSDVLDVLSAAADPARVGAGWSALSACAAESCRALSGPARLLVRLVPRGDVELSLQAWGAGTLDVDVNGGRVARVPLSADGGEARLRVPQAQLRRGFNDLRFTPSGEAAALGRITLRRVGGGA